MRVVNINNVIHHFLHSALWTEELDTNHSIEDFVPSAVEKAREIITLFLDLAPKDSLEVYAKTLGNDFESRLGHDIWLSINGHGAGFFDYHLDGHEDILQNVCESMRWDRKISTNVWVSEVGNIFIE